jgi:hypothetical protein
MANDWIQIAGGGAAGPSGSSSGSVVSDAPNITGATVVVGYQLAGYGPQQVIISGVITLPTSDPKYSHLKKIRITITDPSGNGYFICELDGPWGGSTVAYDNSTGTFIPQPTSNETWATVQFWCYDENGVQAQSPYHVDSIVISGSALVSTSFTEIGPRYSDGNGSVHSTFQFQPVVANAQFPFWTTVRCDFDDLDINTNLPKGPQQFGQPFQLVNDGTGHAVPFTFDHYVPTNASQTNWTLYVIVGADVSDNTPLSALSYVQASLTVTAVTDPTTTDVTNAHFVLDGSGSPFAYGVNGFGAQDFYYYGIQWTQPTGNPPPAAQGNGNDINYYASIITKQRGYSQTGAGTVSGLNTLTAAGISSTVTKAGFDVTIAGVLTTVLTVSAGSLTFTPQAGIANGSRSFDIWNEDPGREGMNDYPGLYKGMQISDTGELTRANGPNGSTVTLQGDAADAWYLPIPIDPVTNLTNPYIQYRFLIYATSRNVQNYLGGNFIRQSCWNGTDDHIYATPTNLSHPLDQRQTNLASVQSIVGFNASGQLGPLGIPVLLSLPTPGPPFYPNGAIVQIGGGLGIFYQNVSGTWVSTQDPAKLLAGAIASSTTLSANQITAGTITAGVVYAGTISASNITGGIISALISINSPTINGGTIHMINGSNSILLDTTPKFLLTDATNLITVSMQPAGGYGVQVTDTSGNNYNAIVYPQGFLGYGTSGQLFELFMNNASGGHLTVRASSGGNTADVSPGQFSCNGSGGITATETVYDGSTTHTVTIKGGIITSWT